MVRLYQLLFKPGFWYKICVDGIQMINPVNIRFVKADLGKFLFYNRTERICINSFIQNAVLYAVTVTKKAFRTSVQPVFIHFIYCTFECKPHPVVELIFVQRNCISDPVKLYKNNACQSNTGNSNNYQKFPFLHTLSIRELNATGTGSWYIFNKTNENLH